MWRVGGSGEHGGQGRGGDHYEQPGAEQPRLVEANCHEVSVVMLHARPVQAGRRRRGWRRRVGG
jgi:hypothetical protein